MRVMPLNILDSGCGCGDQILFYLDRFFERNTKVTAVTSEIIQADVAAHRISTSRFHERVEIFYGDIMQHPKKWHLLNSCSFSNLSFHNSFDLIISLDSCYHYSTRKLFLQKAFAWLQPNHGRLCVTDILLDPSIAQSNFPLGLKAFCYFSGVPISNLIGLSDYKRHWELAGFEDVQILDITENVFGGLARFIERHRSHLKNLISFSKFWQYLLLKRVLDWIVNKKVLRFVISSGRKPNQHYVN